MIKKNQFNLLVMMILLGLSGRVNAFEIDPVQNEVSLGEHSSFIEDEAKKLNVEEVLNLYLEGKLEKSQAKIPNFGFTNSVHWLALTVYNKSEQEIEKLLEVSYPNLDKLDLFIYKGQGRVTHFEMGDSLKFNTRSINHRNFLVPVKFDPNQEYHLVFKTSSSGPVSVPINLWNPQTFYEQNETNMTVEGLFIGIMLVMALYNIFIFISLREISYLYYVFFVTTFAGFSVAMSGITFQYLWPSSPWWSEKSPIFFLTLPQK